MELTLEEYGKYLGDETLTDELALEKYRQEKEKYNNEVNKIVGGYKGLDMDEFIDRIGGQEKIETMNKINEKLDRSYLVNGTLVPKREGNKREDLDEWKRGFMEGYDEAYRRLMESRT